MAVRRRRRPPFRVVTEVRVDDSRWELHSLARVAASAIQEEFARPAHTSAPIYRADGGNRGVAVRLAEGARDRGCYAWYRAVSCLERAAAVAAVRAAFFDQRYARVTAEEVRRLDIEITIFSEWQAMTGPYDFELGRESVSIDFGDTSFTLMQAQVPIQRGWDRDAFLEALCRKVGRPPGAWQNRGARLNKSESAFLRLPFSEAWITSSCRGNGGISL